MAGGRGGWRVGWMRDRWLAGRIDGLKLASYGSRKEIVSAVTDG